LGSADTHARVRTTAKTKIKGPRSLNASPAFLPVRQDVSIPTRTARITLERSGQGATNAIPGTVEAAIFVGSFQVFLVRTGNHEDLLHVQIPAGGTTVSFKQGDEVDLVAEPDAIRLFPIGEP